jgi:hypothetical protein
LQNVRSKIAKNSRNKLFQYDRRKFVKLKLNSYYPSQLATRTKSGKEKNALEELFSARVRNTFFRPLTGEGIF